MIWMVAMGGTSGPLPVGVSSARGTSAIRGPAALDLAHIAHLVHADQVQRQAFGIAPAGAADAVDVHLGVGRHVHVDDGGQVGNVQPARRHVGGHQHRAAAVGKLHQHLVALALLQLAIQRQRAEALGLQHAHQVAALLLGVAKRNRRLGRKWLSSCDTACRRSLFFTSYQRCSILPSACWACTVICTGSS
jgi:hypothetical protein